ncbi:hypothetical protein [Nocardia callitridis]|uniref:Uncharacterized protein n=1 Tax=Nocardia callitridis TaxID=648753 RepID=A0ABP9L056_9NOCA
MNGLREGVSSRAGVEMLSIHPVREFRFTAEQFKVVRQFTFEIGNIPEECLVPAGWTSAIGEFLDQLAHSAQLDIAAATRINFVVSGDMPVSSDVQVPRPEDEVVRHLPASVAEVWPQLLTTVYSWLGDLEARYRTGFNPDEIADALAAFKSK